MNGELNEVPREPDAVAWISPFRLATADEGDLDGGSRGFTFFDRKGQVRFVAGNGLEHQVTRIGHYPEDRLEGLAVSRSGRGFIDTDNDGVVDSSGETQFLRLGEID